MEVFNMEKASPNRGELIKTARKNKGLTQKQLAEKTGLAVVTIQQYERNLRQPRLENIQKIAEALDSTPTYLMGWTEEEKTLNNLLGQKLKLLHVNDYLITKQKGAAYYLIRSKSKDLFYAVDSKTFDDFFRSTSDFIQYKFEKMLRRFQAFSSFNSSTTPPDQDGPEALNAANDRGATPEEKKNADDIMHNPDEWE